MTKKDFQVITDREYGDRGGAFRMLDLIQREKIATTFFVSGIHAIRFPETFKEIKEGGHEIAAETYIHDYAYMKTMEQEWDGIKRSNEAIQQTTGERPLVISLWG